MVDKNVARICKLEAGVLCALFNTLVTGHLSGPNSGPASEVEGVAREALREAGGPSARKAGL